MNKVIDGYWVLVEPEADAKNPMRERKMVTDVVTWMRSYEFSSEDPKPYDGPGEVKTAVESGELAFAAPLFAYIHSGITVNLGEMRATWPDKEWDCGLAGYVYITMEKAKKAWPELSGEALKRACRERAIQDIEVLDQWLKEDVWVYDVTGPDGRRVDSCGWIYGYDEACKMAMEVVENARKKRKG